MTYFASENAITEQDMTGQPGWVEIDAVQHQAAFDALLAGREIAILDSAMVIRDKRPSEHHEWEDGEWVDRTPEPEPEPLDLAAYAAQKRWEKEIGGIEVGGMPVFTDDRSKTLVMGARQAADADPAFTTQWKTATGAFITLDATTIMAVSNAVLAHVASCFAREAAVIAAIGDETITSTAEIDSAFDAVEWPIIPSP